MIGSYRLEPKGTSERLLCQGDNFPNFLRKGKGDFQNRIREFFSANKEFGIARSRVLKRDSGDRPNGTGNQPKEWRMRTKTTLLLGVAAMAIATFASAPPSRLNAQQTALASVSIGDNDLGGVV